MKTFFVATLARYVLVQAQNEPEARQRGLVALREMYADLRKELGRDVQIDIRTVREATPDEIELWTWHHNMLKMEEAAMPTIPRAGARVRLVAMHDDPDPIQVGEVGTVLGVTGHGDGKHAWHQIDVAWDNGRTLMLVSPPDRFDIMDDDHLGHP